MSPLLSSPPCASAAAASFEPPTPQLISKSLLPLSSNLDAPSPPHLQRWSLRPRSLSGRWIRPHFLHAEKQHRLTSPPMRVLLPAPPFSLSSLRHPCLHPVTAVRRARWVIAENDASLRPLRRQFGAESFQLRRASTAAAEAKPNQNILHRPTNLLAIATR